MIVISFWSNLLKLVSFWQQWTFFIIIWVKLIMWKFRYYNFLFLIREMFKDIFTLAIITSGNIEHLECLNIVLLKTLENYTHHRISTYKENVCWNVFNTLYGYRARTHWKNDLGKMKIVLCFITTIYFYCFLIIFLCTYSIHLVCTT